MSNQHEHKTGIWWVDTNLGGGHPENVFVRRDGGWVGGRGRLREIKIDHLVMSEAEFIARACNSHNDLLAACEKALEALAWNARFDETAETTSNLLSAAIAKAKGA